MLELEVQGVRNARDYQRCLAHLQGITIVERVAVLDASAGRVRFRLDLSAAPQYLDRDLADGGVLELDEDEKTYIMIGSEPLER